MKRLLIFLSGVLSIIFGASAQLQSASAESATIIPAPTYPATLSATKVTGTGVCQIGFDPSGHVGYSVMVKSTGSKVLDENTLTFAKANWSGRPYTRMFISLAYHNSDDKRTDPVEILDKITAPNPPYPYQARAGNLQGNGGVEVSFDESGKVVSAVMTQSTGSDILDKNTVSYVKYGWHSSGGKKTKLTLPVSYLLR